MKKILIPFLKKLSGGCGGGCRKIVGAVLIAAMLMTIIPAVFADYQDFTGFDEATHLITDEDLVSGLGMAVGPDGSANTYFYRTNPDGDTTEFK